MVAFEARDGVDMKETPGETTVIFPCLANHHWGANAMFQDELGYTSSSRGPSGEVESEAKWTLGTTVKLIRYFVLANRNPVLTRRNDSSGPLFLDTLPTHWEYLARVIDHEKI